MRGKQSMLSGSCLRQSEMYIALPGPMWNKYPVQSDQSQPHLRLQPRLYRGSFFEMFPRPT